MGHRKSRRPSRKPPMFKISKGGLTDCGYHSSDPADVRHKALKKAAKKYGPGNTVLKLNAICILNKNRAPTASKIFCRDKKWVQKTFGTVKSPKKSGRKSPKKSPKRTPKKKVAKKPTRSRRIDKS